MFSVNWIEIRDVKKSNNNQNKKRESKIWKLKDK